MANYSPIKGTGLPGAKSTEKKTNEREKKRSESYKKSAGARHVTTIVPEGKASAAKTQQSFSPVRGVQESLERMRGRMGNGRKESESAALAHYENAVRGQFEGHDSMRLREKLQENKNAMKGQSKPVQVGYRKQNSVLEKMLAEKEREREQQYTDALRKQFGALSVSQLHEKVQENERAIQSMRGSVIPDTSVAKGYERQNRALMKLILEKEDVARKARYKEALYGFTRNRDKVDFPEMRKVVPEFGKGIRGEEYRFINNINGYREFLAAKPAADEGGTTRKQRALMKMTQDEIDLYNYAYRVEGKKKAQEYLELIEPILNSRLSEEEAYQAKQAAEKHPVASSVYTVASAPVRAMSGAAALVDDLIHLEQGKDIDTNSRWHAVGNESSIIRRTVSDKIERNTDKELPLIGNVASFAYNAGMSIGDSVMMSVTGGVLGKTFGSAAGAANAASMAQKIASTFVSVGMASDSAAQAVVSNKEKGYSDIRALSLGLATGTVEALTEKLAINEIKGAPKSALKALGVSFLSEGTEEMASGVANMAIDHMFSGSDSEISKSIAGYKAKGYSDTQATIQALAEHIVPEFLAGGLAGGAMGGAFRATGVSSETNGKTDIGKKKSRPDVSDKITYDDIVNSGNEDVYFYRNEGNVKARIPQSDVIMDVDGSNNDVAYYNTASEDVESKSVKMQLRDKMSDIMLLPSAANVEYDANDIKSVKQMRMEVIDALAKRGRTAGTEVVREGFGVIDMSYQRLKKGLKYMNEAREIYSVLCVEEVVKNGTQIYYEPNHKTTGNESFTFAAPVKINGEPHAMGVVVQRSGLTGGNKYHVHRVVLPDGSSIVLSKNEETAATIRESSLESERRFSPITAVPNDIISQNSEENNNYLRESFLDEKRVGGVNADPVSAEMYGKAKNIFERLGFRVIDAVNPEVDALSGTDGYVDFKRREVYLNPEAQDPMRQVIKHEIAHILERNNTRFVRSMIRMFRTDFKAEWAKAETKVDTNYAGLGLTDRQGISEIVAEVSLELTTDEVILRTAQNNPGIIPRVQLWLRYLGTEIKKTFGHLTGGRFAELSEAERLELAAHKWKRAYEIAQKQWKKRDLGRDVQFSIAEIKGKNVTYGIGVLLDSDIFGDADNAERKRIAKDYVVNNLAGESFVAYDDGGDPVEISLAGKNEKMVAHDGKRKPVIKELAHKNIHREIKQESVVLANELIENSKYDATKSSEYSHDWVDNYGKNDWEYRTVFLQQRDGSVWEATLNIANASDGRKILYDIDPIIKKEAGPIKSGPTTSNDSVSQKTPSVNSKYMQSDENDASDVQFMYAGEKSATVDKGVLDKAQQMHESGEEPDVIWRQTGWMLGADGKWRYEIDDREAEFHLEGNIPEEDGAGDVLPVYLEHDALFEAYPFLRDIQVVFKEDLGDPYTMASYDLHENKIKIKKEKGLPSYAYREALLHELQHAVQAYEGLTEGANPLIWIGKYHAAQLKRLWNSPEIEAYKKKRGITETTIQIIIDYMKEHNIKRLSPVLAELLYEQTYGEMEARDTSSRSFLTPEKRAKRIPAVMEEGYVPLLLEGDIPQYYLDFIDKYNDRLFSRRHLQEIEDTYDGVSFSIEKSFKEQVHETLSEKVDDGNMVYVGETPMLLKKLGLHNKPMLITRGHLRDMHHKKSSTESKYHGLSEELIDKLPEIISHPAIVFDSIWEQHPENVYILSERTDGDGNPLLVAITPDGMGKYNNVRIEINSVNTMFGKDNPQSFLNALGERAEQVLYMDKKRTQELLKARGRYLPTGLSNLRFDSIIHQSRNIVKKNHLTNSSNGLMLFKTAERSVADIIRDLELIDAQLDNDALTDEEYRSLDRRSRKLERELSMATARRNLPFGVRDKNAAEETESAAKAQQKDVPVSHHTDKLRESVKAYRETGDSSGIPTRKSTKHSQKYYTEQMDAIMEEIKRVDAEMRSGELTPEEMDVARDRKDMLLTRLRSVGSSANVIKDVLGVLDEIDTEARPNHTWVNDISPDLSDKKNVVKNGTYGFNDFERNVRHFFGKHFAIAKEKILDPLFQSKKDYAEYVTQYSDRIYNEVVKGLGIKKGSKLSAAVQWLGEGQRPMDGKRKTKTEAFEAYTYEKCVQEFGKEDAAKIKKAAEIFRECYDEMIDGVNATRQRLYPNNPDKLIPKRKDYFRHFQEMNNSVPGLIETMRNHAGIDPLLVGVSESTKPKSKWQAAFQTRAGERTVYDAVGGFLDYLPQAAYATHIDPNIVNIRSLACDLESAKAKEGVNGNPNANSFIRYLQNYANKLAGKTVSHLDRAIADSTIGRPLIAGLSWFNNRAKANAVLGNFSSMLSQFANILNSVGTIKNQTDLANGALDAVRGLFGDKEIQAKYEESGFLKERFLGKKYDRFEHYGLTRLAADALGIADEVGTRITWCAAYREGVRLGKADSVSYADSVTRGCVAGRGIGEIPLNFESTVAKLFLPFRIEVNNNINVYRDILFGNDFEGGKAKKITSNMTDAQRYSILRDKTLKVAKAKPLVSENITEADIERLKTKYKKEAKPILKKLADFFGVVGRYENKDIELEFEFSNNSLRESVTKQKKEYALFAKMLSVFDEVIENAIGLEVHPDKYAGTSRAENTLKQTYVLASAFSDESGVYPVKLTVKEYLDRDNKLHVAVVVNKKEDTVFKQDHAETALAYPRASSGDAVGKQALLDKATSYSRASSNISLAQLLSIVKDEDFDKYIPKQFKNLKQTDFDEIVQDSGESGGVVKRSAAHRTKQILKLFVASAIINALFGALKSDEFNPLDDLFGAGEDDEKEERDVFDRILALGKDYVDGYGDGVAFDPLHAVVSGVYQGATENKETGIGEKIGRSALRSVQNIAGDYLSNDPLASVGIGAIGVDNDAIEKIFNGKLYVSPGTGMPAASSIAKSIGYLADGKYASAGAEAAKTFALPFGGSQVDKSARGLYEFATGASTTTRPYERMVGVDEGKLKYLIEPNAENLIKSTLFGPSAFSGASDDCYNSKRRLTEEETDEVLALPDYKSRKVTFDDLIAGKEYRADDTVTARRDATAEEYKNLVGENSAIYALYKNGVMAASPFRNVPLDMRMTIDGTKYTLNISADDATAASETLSAVLSERFREIDKSEKFRKMTPEKQEKYLGSIGDLEYEKIKADVLYERGIMPEDVYLDYVFSYERSRANQDRKMFVDDAQEFVDAQAATMAQQYMQYIGDERITDEVVRQVQKYTDYATHRAPTDVDKELMRLSNSLQTENADLSDLNACGNPSGVLAFTKKGVEYYINVPDTMTYEIMATVDDSCRSALSSLFSSSAYVKASDAVKKDLISKTKSNVRKRVKDNLKVRFPSVRVDMFQQIVDMGGKK